MNQFRVYFYAYLTLLFLFYSIVSVRGYEVYLINCSVMNEMNLKFKGRGIYWID